MHPIEKKTAWGNFPRPSVSFKTDSNSKNRVSRRVTDFKSPCFLFSFDRDDFRIGVASEDGSGFSSFREVGGFQLGFKEGSPL